MSRRDDRKFVEEMAAKQRNILWPNTLVNSRAVDAFLWRGSPNPSIVQRIAACLPGLTFLTGGVALFSFARQEGSRFLGAFALGWILLGLKVGRNSWPRK